MKEHMAKARDTNAPLLLAPPSKKAMRWTAIGGTEGLLTIPGRQIVSKCLRKVSLNYRFLRCSPRTMKSKVQFSFHFIALAVLLKLYGIMR